METRAAPIAEPGDAPDEGDAATDGTGGHEPRDRLDAVDPVDPADDLTPADRRRLRRAWWAGALPTLLVYGWVLMVERWSPLQRQYFDDFFDLQARSFFNGRLDVPPGSVGFEGFLIGGKTYIYFGPLPALLRMPVLAVTDRFDGRLTTLSMLAGMVVLAVASFRLACVVRAMVRGPAPVGRREVRTTAVLAVAVLFSPPFWLASSAVVYHEATIWGVALSVAGLDAVARWQRRPTGRGLLIASALITGAVLSRQTLGLGPLLALGLAGLTLLVRRWRTGDPAERRLAVRRLLPALVLAGFLPVALSAGLNYAKLGQLFGLPMDRHLQSLMTDDRDDVLAENTNFIGGEYVTTTARQYLRPDALDVRSDFPYLDFPRRGPTLMDRSAVFDELDWSSSIPSSAPALTVLALAGVVWTVRSRRRRDFASRLSPLWLGALAGGASVLAFGYVANRYLNDLYPLVVVGGLVGFHAAGTASASWRPALWRALLGGAGLLVGVGVLANLALALEYQHERGPVVPEAWRADWVRWRVALPGAPSPVSVDRDDRLPPVADGVLAVVGDCDGLYVGVRDRWLGVERGPGVGVHDVRLDVDDLPVGDRLPLLTFRTDGQSTVVGIVRLADGTVRVDVLPAEWTDADWQLGVPAELDGTVTLQASADPRQLTANLQHGGTVLNATALPSGSDEVTIGEAPDREGVARSLPGVEAVRPDRSLCEEALGG
ncbi:MAG TPA: hypothetical protein VK306_11530 [Acidimicrobiales bacterium]|nr:hypothetical protein [Acidimicrobiales bacterium]